MSMRVNRHQLFLYSLTPQPIETSARLVHLQLAKSEWLQQTKAATKVKLRDCIAVVPFKNVGPVPWQSELLGSACEIVQNQDSMASRSALAQAFGASGIIFYNGSGMLASNFAATAELDITRTPLSNTVKIPVAYAIGNASRVFGYGTAHGMCVSAHITLDGPSDPAPNRNDDNDEARGMEGQEARVSESLCQHAEEDRDEEEQDREQLPDGEETESPADCEHANKKAKRGRKRAYSTPQDQHRLKAMLIHDFNMRVLSVRYPQQRLSSMGKKRYAKVEITVKCQLCGQKVVLRGSPASRARDHTLTCRQRLAKKKNPMTLKAVLSRLSDETPAVGISVSEAEAFLRKEHTHRLLLANAELDGDDDDDEDDDVVDVRQAEEASRPHDHDNNNNNSSSSAAGSDNTGMINMHESL